ncbi:STAS domain-containing protein [Streptomyces sp. IBSNAI002]|uniref:STAS domain-containing protein n=1 Tax=Streptomyces sp. IBSNAI002 TaxID=3457500 RepID=UPI003FD25186
MITTEVQRCGSTLLIGVSGDLDAAAAPVLQGALAQGAVHEGVLMVDLQGVAFMDSAGLLLVLDLHRRAECLGLRVLVVGWQSQPQRLMARVASMPGPGSSTGERYALAGFRRLIEKRAWRENFADLDVALDGL